MKSQASFTPTTTATTQRAGARALMGARATAADTSLAQSFALLHLVIGCRA